MTDLNEIFIPESDYPAEMKSRVLPYINARRSDGYFDGYDGKSLHYVSCALTPNDPKPKATVIISHGFTESAEKWHETAYYLLNDGYNVYIIEHRGHALSYRAVADKTLTHVDKFDEYVDDFGIFVNLVRSEQNGDLYLLAHSMGCAVGLLYAEKNPDEFKKIFLSSPMIVPCTGGVPIWIGRFITRTVKTKNARLFRENIPATKSLKIRQKRPKRDLTNTMKSSAQTPITKIIRVLTVG